MSATQPSAIVEPSPAVATSPSLPARFPTLDGVRGLAILIVLMHNFSRLSQPDGIVAHVLAAWFDRGWIGVQLFFVLSGFLITGILLDTRNAPNYFKSFFARRILRIFPLYYATLFVMFAVLPLFHLARHAAPSEIWLLVYLSNWVQSFHPGVNSLGHFWSLAVEEQFYLLWPFVVYRCDARQVLRLSIVIAVTALAARGALLFAGFSKESVYEFSVCRMDALALGAAAAAMMRLPDWRGLLVGREKQLLAWSLFILLAGAPLSHAYQQYDFLSQLFGYSFLAVAFALFILAVACADLSGRSGWSALLRHDVLKHFALYSYAMYVLHIPLQGVVGLPLLRALGWEDHSSAWITLLYIGAGTLVTYMAAMISYYAFEVHFLRMKPSFTAAR